MFTTIEGVYRHGRIELVEPPHDIGDETPVLVTFLAGARGIDLRSRGINSQQAAELRTRLAAFAEDWDSPEMSVYDDYDSLKVGL